MPVDPPPLRTDLVEARHDLDIAGCCRVVDLLDPELTTDLREATERLAAQDKDDRSAYLYGGANQRLWGLPGRDGHYLQLAEHAEALGLISHVIGPDPLLSNLSANIAGPGGGALGVHVDQHWSPRPWPYALVANAIWMLDDFTADNGATVVVPGSHLEAEEPGQHRLVPLVGPAGTCIVLDGRTWHGTGPNASARPRTALLAYYCRPYLRQQENFGRSLPATVVDGLSGPRRHLLGFESYEYLNLVGGPPAATRDDPDRTA